MGLLTNVKQYFSKRATSGGSFHVSQQPPGWIDEFKGWLTTSGVTVNEETALNFITVYACMRILAESVASLPLIVYERLPNGGKRRAIEHPLYSLLHDQPNDEMTSFQMREGLEGHLALWGNAFTQIITNGAGNITALWPLLPDRMRVERREGKLVYIYRKDAAGEATILQANQVMHIPGFGYDGLTGYSPIHVARNAIATGMAADEYGARFFENDARPGGVYTHPGHLSDEAYKRLKDEMEERHKGVSKSHRIAILEEGMTFKEIGIPPEDAQFLQTRTFQIREIARMYRIPPHMLADLERASFSNIEQQSIDFVVNTLRPWLVRWEQQILMKLFTPSERKTYFAEFLVDGLMRGDIQMRYGAYNVGRQGGWLSVNDVREMENMNPIEGGDEYLVPLNMVPAGSDQSANSLLQAGIRGKSEAEKIVSPLQNDEVRTAQAARRRRRLMTSYKRVFEDTAKRIMRRETNDIRKAGEKFLTKGDRSGFDGWMSGFLVQHEEYVVEVMAPIYLAYSDLVAQLAEEEVDKLKGRGIGGFRPTTTHNEYELRREEWLEKRADNLNKFVSAYNNSYGQRHIATSQQKVVKRLDQATSDNRDLNTELDDELDEWEELRPEQISVEEASRSNNAFAGVVFSGLGITKIMSVAFGKSCPYCVSLDGKIIGIEENYINAGEDFQPDGADAPLVSHYDLKHAPYHSGCDCMNIASE